MFYELKFEQRPYAEDLYEITRRSVALLDLTDKENIEEVLNEALMNQVEEYSEPLPAMFQEKEYNEMLEEVFVELKKHFC